MLIENKEKGKEEARLTYYARVTERMIQWITRRIAITGYGLISDEIRMALPAPNLCEDDDYPAVDRHTRLEVRTESG